MYMHAWHNRQSGVEKCIDLFLSFENTTSETWVVFSAVNFDFSHTHKK